MIILLIMQYGEKRLEIAKRQPHSCGDDVTHHNSWNKTKPVSSECKCSGKYEVMLYAESSLPLLLFSEIHRFESSRYQSDLSYYVHSLFVQLYPNFFSVSYRL